jgi:CheY-like chemotaxis protein/HPt (histidine-containing phosphotransfer) domain-containing protein
VPQAERAALAPLPPLETAQPPATLSAAADAPLVLLVEDNAVNREVAVGMLENLGYRTESAVNGLLALEAVAESEYAAVLMDCQMPVMDGLTATAEIRRREQKAGTRRMHIIALTANAMEGNRDRCIGAGMDDFLSKPFSQAQLAGMLQRWVPAAPTRRAPLAPPPAARIAGPIPAPAPRSPVIDPDVLRDIMALGRPALLGSLIDLYLEHSPPLIDGIDAAIRNQQPSALGDALHTLKSSTANLGGIRLAALLKECEGLVSEGRLADARPALDRIAGGYREFCEALTLERSRTAA